MKRMFLIMAIAIVTTFQVSAQDNNRQQMTAQQRTEQRIKQLDEKLVLTDEQKTKIRGLYADFNKLLTAEQQNTYKQMVEQAIAEKKNGKRNKPKE